MPNDSGLTQYTLQGETTDAAALVEKMAEKGAFPADVVLEALDESDGVVRLQFSGALQSYIDGASSAAALEAISKTFRAFYEAGGRSIETLEIYAAGEPVTVEYDRLIDRQLERAAITTTAGFAKLFADAGKVLKV